MRAPTITVERARRLRRTMTLPEVLLWQELRSGRCGGLRFRRQHPIGRYILDFYCAAIVLAVEVDGAAHDHEERVGHDARRDAWLADQGITVLRVAARDVLDRDGRDAVVAMITAAAPSTTLRAVPLPRSAGEDELS
jgi:very-short-patch-repair endonuclease